MGIWLKEGELKAVNEIQDISRNRHMIRIWLIEGELKTANEIQDFHIFMREAVNEIRDFHIF